MSLECIHRRPLTIDKKNHPRVLNYQETYGRRYHGLKIETCESPLNQVPDGGPVICEFAFANEESCPASPQVTEETKELWSHL